MTTFAPPAAIWAKTAPVALVQDHGTQWSPLEMQRDTEQVLFERTDAWNELASDPLMDQSSREVLRVRPKGVQVEERLAAGKVFSQHCRLRENGGSNGAETYTARGDLIHAQVTTFDPADTKFN